jgi:hypothetical protein
MKNSLFTSFFAVGFRGVSVVIVLHVLCPLWLGIDFVLRLTPVRNINLWCNTRATPHGASQALWVLWRPACQTLTSSSSCLNHPVLAAMTASIYLDPSLYGTIDVDALPRLTL